MKDTLKKDLEALTCEGNVASLPSAPLNDYATLKKTLTKANGKYKKNAFVFPNQAQDVINTLLGGTVVDFKKEFQFFATPPELAQQMVSQLIGVEESPRVLEPSAGHGALIDAMIQYRPMSDIVGIELSDLNYRTLQGKYKELPSVVSLFKTDFLAENVGLHEPKYDVILANPPFTKNQDIDHIMKMYELLAPGGQMVTIASQSWTFGSQKKQVAFREFVEENASMNVELGQGTFKSSGTGVSARLLVFYK